MTDYKFNTGDKVIELQLDYFDNPYHFESSVVERTVKDANYLFFTIANDDDFNQKNGVCTWRPGKVYHKEKDKQLIFEEIERAVKKYDEDRQREDDNKISELESKIKEYQDEINKIKEGKGVMKIGFTKYDKKEYKAKVLRSIYKKLNYDELNTK